MFSGIFSKSVLNAYWKGVQRPVIVSEPPGITFSISSEYPDKVFEINETLHRVIGTKSGRNLYSIKALGLGGNDMKTCAGVKHNVVENILLKSNYTTDRLPTLAGVQEMCLGFLSSIKTGADPSILSYIIAHDIIGEGPFSILLEDSANIEEIEINSPNGNIMVYHSKYGRCTTNLQFNSVTGFRFMINKLIERSGKELSQSSPIIDAQLDGGSRVHAQLKPYALSESIATIRVGSGKGISIKKLLNSKAVTPDILAYLWLAIENGQNMVITGAPASGKTSLLIALHALMPFYERIITVEEDINELRFYENMENTVSLQGSTRERQKKVKDQIANALHLRPDRLIAGEIRGEEAKEVFSGSNLGVPFITTMHSSEGGVAVINRLRGSPMNVEEHTLNMLDISIFMQRVSETGRMLENISEYRWLSRGEIKQPMGASADPAIAKIVGNGVIDNSNLKESKVLGAYASRNAISIKSALLELKKRTEFIDGLASDAAVMSPADVYKYILKYWMIG